MGLSEFLRKTFVSQTSRAKEAGQAVIEYLLVMVITLAIILGLMYQFNDAFKQFLDTYFGDYIACLLETGELPSLGGNGPNQSQCVSPYGDYNLSAGASQYDTNSGSSGSGGGSSRSSSEGDGGGDGSSSGGGSGSRSNRSLRRSNVSSTGGAANSETLGNSKARNGRPSSVKQSQSQNQTKQNGFESDSSEGSFGGGRGRTRRRKRIIYLGDNYTNKDAKEKGSPAVVGKSSSKKKKGGKGDLRKPSFALDVPESKKMGADDKKPGFQFGILIKILLIAGIVIAIFLLLGGQALQIKKSWQKSE